MNGVEHAAYHEAGHAVIAYLLGRDLSDLCTRRKDHAGRNGVHGCAISTSLLADDIADLGVADESVPCDLDGADPLSEAMVYAAGRQAELLFFGKAHPLRTADDESRVSMLSLLLNEEERRDLDRRVSEKVLDSYIPIMFLAEELTRAETVPRDKARHIIQASLLGDWRLPPLSNQLSMRPLHQSDWPAPWYARQGVAS